MSGVSNRSWSCAGDVPVGGVQVAPVGRARGARAVGGGRQPRAARARRRRRRAAHRARSVLPHLNLPRLTSTRLISLHCTPPHILSPHLTSSYLTSSHLTSSHINSPPLTSPDFTSHQPKEQPSDNMSRRRNLGLNAKTDSSKFFRCPLRVECLTCQVVNVLGVAQRNASSWARWCRAMRWRQRRSAPRRRAPNCTTRTRTTLTTTSSTRCTSRDTTTGKVCSPIALSTLVMS